MKTDLVVKFPAPTRYDVIKTFAVIIMIIDHIGVYFTPDEPWWRAVGRIGFPVWFFLIGYAHSRQIGTRLLYGAVILLLANILFGILVIPLNALVSIILIRLSLDWITKKIGFSETRLFLSLLVFILINPLLNFLWEYGSLAFIFALCGHYSRNGFGDKKIIPLIVALLAFLGFVYTQQVQFSFSIPAFAFMSVGTLLTMTALLFYLPKSGPALQAKSSILSRFLMLGGRYTLEIYVLHLLLFKLVYYLVAGCGGSFCVLH